MEDSTPEFLPFTRRQLDLLAELKAEIEKRDALSALDPEMPKINERIDDLSVIVSRFALKNIPKESRHPGEFIIEVPTCLPLGRLQVSPLGYGAQEILEVRLLPGEYEIKPGFAVFHPYLPPWAKNHFIKWIREHRAGFRRYDGREVLRETGIVGIETSMKRPKDMTFLIRVLVLRDYEVKNDSGEEDGPIPSSWGEELDEMLRNARRQRKVEEKKRTRTRKKLCSWNWVIEKLVEEGFLPKKISHQALKKMLKNRYPEWPWEEV